MTTSPTHEPNVSPFIFEGNKISLRPLTLDDCTPAYVAWLNDPEVHRYLETRWYGQQTLDSVRHYVEEALKPLSGEHMFAIIAGPAHIGNIKIGSVNLAHKSAVISYFIGERSCWGKGYATEAIRGATRRAFGKLGLYNLQAGSYAKNVASIKALKRCGYKERGRLLNALCTTAESRDDHVLLSLTLPEFKSCI
jgi:ribosomal-protein-alanine N-acetyltransferase